MGKRQKYLERICSAKYGNGHHSRPDEISLFNSSFSDEIHRIYKKLGGILDTPPTRTGPYDIDLEDFIIELDEENHFNRYRKSTLESVIYDNNSNLKVGDYKLFSDNFENRCRCYGKFWTTPSCEKQFGIGGPEKVLLKEGSARWKQRAFYDFIKDCYSLITQIPIVRVSIYSTYNGFTIDELLKREDRVDLLNYIELRLHKLPSQT